MEKPTVYILVSEGERCHEGTEFINLDWGKEEANKAARGQHMRQTIYKLVPVYEVDVTVTYDFPIKEIEQ